MLKRIFGVFILSGLFSVQGVWAQDKLEIKFGKIGAADFSLSADKFDSGANAVIIADIGNTSFLGNAKGSFTLVFTRFIRVKIVNKNGFDIGERRISLFHNSDGDVEKLVNLKGSTFNLENGAVIESKLDEKSINVEKLNKDFTQTKFSMPALKEGSIFDLEYTIKSPFDFLLQPWAFQGEYPCLWSEYEVTIAPPFHYVMLQQGDQHFDVYKKKEIISNYSIQENNPGAAISGTNMYNVSGTSINQRWVKKNVPALHQEPYTTTLKNYNSRVSFQLNYFQWNQESERHDHLNNWNSASKTLLEDENFGASLNQENAWMANELKTIQEGSNSPEETTKRIFKYVRDNLNAVGKDGYSKDALFTRSSLKEVFQKKEGNVAEVNLLLTAMLRKAGIHADPLILSTRDHGIANAGYPLIDEYNYVICAAYPTDKMVVLDASEPYNGYGQLPVSCYNGWGHVINEEKPLPVNFSADSIRETSFISVIVINDEKNQLSGAYKRILGKSESADLREKIAGTSEDAYRKEIVNGYGSDFALENFGIDSLHKFDYPITIHYDFDLKNFGSGNILYFNPMLNEGYKTNPFKSMERHYPVEIPYLIDETYQITMEIPVGYQIDEMPKSTRVNFNENEGMFEYLIQKGESNFQLRVKLKFNKAFFSAEEYATLRDFFEFVVKKENEQIVFKKGK